MSDLKARLEEMAKPLLHKGASAWAHYDAIRAVALDLLAKLELREAEVAALTFHAKWLLWDHVAPEHCFSSGPMTGTPMDDECPACWTKKALSSTATAAQEWEAHIRKEERERFIRFAERYKCISHDAEVVRFADLHLASAILGGEGEE